MGETKTKYHDNQSWGLKDPWIYSFSVVSIKHRRSKSKELMFWCWGIDVWGPKLQNVEWVLPDGFITEKKEFKATQIYLNLSSEIGA